MADARPWGFCCYEEEKIYFARLEGDAWMKTPMDFRGEGRAEALGALLPRRRTLGPLARDAVFLEALRDAALLVSLSPEASLCCKIRPDQLALAEAVVYDLYCNAMPRLVFLPFAAGTGGMPGPGFRLVFLTNPPEEECQGAFADFTAEQPSLRLNFPGMNFAQRTLRALLPPLGLGILLSMWNAASRDAQARLGAHKAAQYCDLVAWLMLRRNFAANEYPISEAEHGQLLRRAEEYEMARRVNA